jgi:hypothetical protein
VKLAPTLKLKTFRQRRLNVQHSTTTEGNALIVAKAASAAAPSKAFINLSHNNNCCQPSYIRGTILSASGGRKGFECLIWTA